MISTYSDGNDKCSVVLINLVDKKKDQKKLGDAYDSIVSMILARHSTSSAPNEAAAVTRSATKPTRVMSIRPGGPVLDPLAANSLTYVWFDFHAECKKKGKWKNLVELVKLIKGPSSRPYVTSLLHTRRIFR